MIAVAYIVVVDEETHNKLVPETLAGAMSMSCAYIGATLSSRVPANVNNPLVFTFRSYLNVVKTYQINLQVWVEDSGFNLDRLTSAFVAAWNATFANAPVINFATNDRSNIEFIFPGSEPAWVKKIQGRTPDYSDYDGAIAVINDGGQFAMQEAQNDIPFVGSVVDIVVPTNHFRQATVAFQRYGVNDTIPILGVSRVDDITISSVIQSNLPSLRGKDVNPITFALLANNIVSNVREAGSAAYEALAPTAREIADSVSQLHPENLLPITPNEWNIMKNVLVYGGIILGGVLIINGINRGTGK